MNVKLKTHLFIFFLISVIPVCYINFVKEVLIIKKSLQKCWYHNKKNVCIDCKCDGHINKYAEECSYNKKHVTKQ